MSKNILSLFGGIECGYQAFKELEMPIDNYYSCEIDPYAKAIAKYQHPNIIELGDITTLTETKLKDLPKIDWVIGGSPCQSFSIAGNGKGFDGKSGLFYEFIRILKWIKTNNNPNVSILFENVKMKKEWENTITNELLNIDNNIILTFINSKDYSAQNRPRLYWTNFNIIDINKNDIQLKDIMQNDSEIVNIVRPTETRLAYIKRKINKGWLKREFNDINTSKSSTLLASMYKQMQEFIWKNENGLRFFTPIECERLQTLPDNYTQYGNFDDKIKEISNTQRYKSVGNGWTIEVIKTIIENEIRYKNNIYL